MQEKATISIECCKKYDFELLKGSITNLFLPFGGIQKFVKSGDRVVIKPNLLKPAHPDDAVTTHPILLKALLQLCLDLGAKPIIGDSPGFFSLKRVAEVTGLKIIADEMGVAISEFKSPVPVQSIHKGKTLHHFKLDRLIVEADCVINVPKVKAHQQLVLTGAVKNLYGSIPGKRKAKYHYQFGDRHNLFAEMLVENYQLIRPSFTIADGITAMEGNGPARGRPRQVGILVGGTDGIAIDRVLCEILGIPHRELRTLKAAEDLKVGVWDIEKIEIVGKPLAELKVPDFLMAEPMPIKFQFTRVIRSILRNLYYRHIKERKAAEVTVLQ